MNKRQISPLEVTGAICATSIDIRSITNIPVGESKNVLAQKVAELSPQKLKQLKAELAEVMADSHAQFEEVLKKYLDLD